MKRLFVILFLVLAIGGGYWAYKTGFFTHPDHSNTSEKAIYYCPMHPFYTSDKPGECPICHMKLVKRETDDHGHVEHHEEGKIVPKELTVQELMSMKPGEICLLHKCKMGKCMIAMTPEMARLGKCPHCGEDLGIVVKDLAPKGYANVKISPEKEALIDVKTEPVQKIPMIKTIRTFGKIAYDPDLYRAEEEFAQAAQALRKAESGSIPDIKEQAEHLIDSAKLKLKLLGLSDELIQEVEASGKPDRSLLYSDAGGHVWLYAPIYEYEISMVKVDQKIEVEVPSFAGQKFTGQIRAIDRVLDSMTRSVRVRAILENPEGFLKPEMYVNATLQADLGNVLQVPREAIFKTGDKNIVFVKKEGGTFEPREVVLGAESEGRAEVKSGLLVGEAVVTSGNFLIDSESRLKAALEGAVGGGHSHGG